jgi:hypothetical protein
MVTIKWVPFIISSRPRGTLPFSFRGKFHSNYECWASMLGLIDACRVIAWPGIHISSIANSLSGGVTYGSWWALWSEAKHDISNIIPFRKCRGKSPQKYLISVFFIFTRLCNCSLVLKVRWCSQAWIALPFVSQEVILNDWMTWIMETIWRTCTWRSNI